ncbi:MAG TPA: hypothetical protein VGD90_07830, partial [Sphingobacteriaceae bacterium]
RWSWLLLLIVGFSTGCRKDSPSPEVEPLLSRVSSPEFENGLLFVNTPDYQIQTTEAATFSTLDPRIQVTAGGLIQRVTSGAVVAIDVNWSSSGTTSRIYALGATDDQHDEPYATYHGRLATDPVSSYRKGWQTLQKLPRTDSSFAIVLRHADANVGRDDADGPANWWKSCDEGAARQLNDTGRQHSAELGLIFKELGYPIGRVISSEFCRAKTTAELINAGPLIVTDPRINHPEHNKSGKSLFRNMLEVMQEQPVDTALTLMVTHHPINETRSLSYPTFPEVSPFPWTGAYFVKIDPDKTITYHGAVSFDMFKYWRDIKMNRLGTPGL